MLSTYNTWLILPKLQIYLEVLKMLLEVPTILGVTKVLGLVVPKIKGVTKTKKTWLGSAKSTY